jgi:uroporphyrinogen-III synthase
VKDKIHIVSTASLPVECLQRLKQQGFEAEVIPFIRTYPSVSDKEVQRIKELQDNSTTAVFTSAHGVEAVVMNLDRKPSWKIACISGATLEAVKKYFDEANVIAAAPHAKQLAKEIINQVNEPVVFFCGNKRLDTIPQQLKTAGIPVEEIAVYHTELTPQPVKHNAAAILFFSSSAVESFFMKNDLADTTICFAIGDTTAETLRQKGGNRIIIAANPGKKEMIELLINYYNEHS